MIGCGSVQREKGARHRYRGVCEAEKRVKSQTGRQVRHLADLQRRTRRGRSLDLANAPVSGHDASGLSTIHEAPRSVIIDRLKVDDCELQIRRAGNGSCWWSVYNAQSGGYSRAAAEDEASTRRDGAACVLSDLTNLSAAGRTKLLTWYNGANPV